MRKGFWIYFVIVFAVCNLCVQMLIWTRPLEDRIKEVKCYDKYSNEIRGLVCEEMIYGRLFYHKCILGGICLVLSFLGAFFMNPYREDSWKNY